MDDSELLRTYAEEGSESAFTTLVERHLDLVFSAALRRMNGDPHRAREVSQAVFTDLACNAGKLTRHPLLAGWLHSSTRWAAANLRRSEQRRQVHEQAAALEQTLIHTAEPKVDWDHLRPLLDDALDSLSARDREAVLLRYFNNQPFAAIGTRLGLGENAARMRVERALDKLRGQLVRRGLTSTAAALGLLLSQNAVSAAPVELVPAITSSAVSAGAVGTSGVVSFLFMTKLQLALATALVVTLGIGVSWQYGENERLQQQLSSLRQQTDVLQTSAKSFEQNAVQQQAEQSRLAEIAASTITRLPPLTPEQQERVRLDTIIRKGELDMEYMALFRKMHLPAGQLDGFKTLLVQRNQAIYDATRLAKEESVVYASAAEAQAVEDSVTAEFDQQLAGLLGPAKFGEFRDFEREKPFRMLSSGLLDGAPSTLTPTPEQDKLTDRLAKLLATAYPEYPEILYRENGWPTPVPASAMEDLRAVLNPEQFSRLESQQKSATIWRRLCEIAHEAALQGKLKLSKGSARDYPAPAKN